MLEKIKATSNLRLACLMVAALCVLSACGGGGTITGSGANGELVVGDTFTHAGQTFTVTAISADRSTITVSTRSSGFALPSAIDLQIVLLRGGDGLYRYSTNSLTITYDPSTGAITWSVLQGSSETTIVNEILSASGSPIITGNGATADYNQGAPSNADVPALLAGRAADLTTFATDNAVGHSIDLSYGNINVRGLAQAHAAGWTGLGAEVNIIDEFGPNAQGFDNGSFTHGVISYYSSWAVAPEATYAWTEHSTFNYAGSNAFPTIDVVNWSFGQAGDFSDDATYEDSIDFVRAFAAYYYEGIGDQNPNAVLVYAAGNEGAVTYSEGGAAECETTGSGASLRYTAASCSPVLGALDPNSYSYLDRSIWVGSYDSAADDLEWYSFSAGSEAMNYFMVADGHSVIDGAQGTSFAAPRVAGVVALTVQKFPNLTAQERTRLILQTGYDLGAPGVDPVYGHGLVDANAALNPIGLLE